jgi:tRNA nucleotidyltransferase (CCA-adding enzyme)
MEKVSGKRIFNELFLIMNEHQPLPDISRLAQLDVLRYIHPSLTSKVDYSKSFDEARRAIDWYDLLYTGIPCERWLCYFLVFTAVLDRTEIKNLCGRLQIVPRYCDILSQQRSTALGILKRLEGRSHDQPSPRPSSLYRWFKPLATEILLFLMARAGKESVRQWLSLYITHMREVQPMLTGHDLEKLGIAPGPIFRIILDDLLCARLDERVVTVEDERALVQRKYQKEMKRL